VVYGIGRDQGMTSKTTMAILAAAAGKPYTVPFSGAVSGLHAGEVASAFIASVSKERNEAVVFDHNGVPCTVEAWLDLVRKVAPDAKLKIEGEALPFPAELSDEPIREFLGDFGHMSLGEGIQATFEGFQALLRNGVLSDDALN
jgi:nucleoside-diphosphate-sugar epimerase